MCCTSRININVSIRQPVCYLQSTREWYISNNIPSILCSSNHSSHNIQNTISVKVLTRNYNRRKTYFICDNFDLIFGLTNYMSLQQHTHLYPFHILPLKSHLIPMVFPLFQDIFYYFCVCLLNNSQCNVTLYRYTHEYWLKCY